MANSGGVVNPHLLSHVHVGDELEVWWPKDSSFYLARVDSELEGGRHRIIYEDGKEYEDLSLATERWRLSGAAEERFKSALAKLAPGAPAQNTEGSEVISETLDISALLEVRVGDELEVWWPIDASFYLGRVDSILDDGSHRIIYEDGEIEELALETEQWRFKCLAADRLAAALKRTPGASAQNVSGSDVRSETSDTSRH